jgi:hypothetical protein
MSDKYSEAIKVKDTEEIYDILAKKYCPDCYLNLDVGSQSHEKHGDKYYDTLLAACPDCKRSFTFIFDVTDPINAINKFL